MYKRKRMHNKKSRRVFTKFAMKTKKKNIRVPMRGGFRI